MGPMWLIVLISVLVAVGVGLLIFFLCRKSNADRVKAIVIEMADVHEKINDPNTTADERTKLEKKFQKSKKDLAKAFADLGKEYENDPEGFGKLNEDMLKDPKFAAA